MKRALARIVELGLPPLALFCLLVAAWEAAVVLTDAKPYFVPRPARVWTAALEHGPALVAATRVTAAAALAGFAASLAIGFSVALFFSQSKLVARSVYPYAIFLQTVPIVGIAPLIVLWFGNGFQSVVIVSFVISLFPILTNATAGLARVDKNLIELFRLYHASRWQTLMKLRIPNAVPYVVTGAKISWGLAVVGAIVGELFVGRGGQGQGLGYLIFAATSTVDTAYLFAAVFCSTLLGVVIFALANVVGATVLRRWHTGGGHTE